MVSLSLHPLSLICAGPNHGGKREGEVSLFEMFWVLMVQGEDLRVCQLSEYATHACPHVSQVFVMLKLSIILYIPIKLRLKWCVLSYTPKANLGPTFTVFESKGVSTHKA